jgi:hypothetical protein
LSKDQRIKPAMRTKSHFNVSHNKPDSKQKQENQQVSLINTLRLSPLIGIRPILEEV